MRKDNRLLTFAHVQGMVRKIPNWVRKDLSAEDAARRERAEDALVAMVLATGSHATSADAVTLDGAKLPWTIPASVGVKRKHELEYSPEVSGLNLRQAAEFISSNTANNGMDFCIWTRLGETEYILKGKSLHTLMKEVSRGQG